MDKPDVVSNKCPEPETKLAELAAHFANDKDLKKKPFGHPPIQDCGGGWTAFV